MRAEISYDLVMDDDMSFVEGTYRLPDGEWQVYVVTRDDVSEPRVEAAQWEGGVTGVCVRYPRSVPLGRSSVERVLSAALGMREWVEVRGPDSIQLR